MRFGEFGLVFHAWRVVESGSAGCDHQGYRERGDVCGEALGQVWDLTPACERSCHIVRGRMLPFNNHGKCANGQMFVR